MRTIEINENILDKENKVLSDFDFLQIGSLLNVADTLCFQYSDGALKEQPRDGLFKVHTIIRAISRLLEETEGWTTELLSDIDAIKRT